MNWIGAGYSLTGRAGSTGEDVLGRRGSWSNGG